MLEGAEVIRSGMPALIEQFNASYAEVQAGLKALELESDGGEATRDFGL